MIGSEIVSWFSSKSGKDGTRTSPTIWNWFLGFAVWRSGSLKCESKLSTKSNIAFDARKYESKWVEIHAFLIIVHGRGLFDSDNQILLLTITFSFSETHAFVLQRFNEMIKLIIYRETYVTSNFGQKCHICRFIYILFHLLNFKPQIRGVINISITATL